MHINYKENPESPEMTYGILQSYFALWCTYLDLSSLFSFLLYVSTLHKLMISKGNSYIQEWRTELPLFIEIRIIHVYPTSSPNKNN